MRLKKYRLLLLAIPALVLFYEALDVSMRFFAGEGIYARFKKHAMQYELESYELPTMTVSLSTQSQTIRNVRIGINLEVEPQNVVKLEKYRPFIIDGLQTSLQDITVEDAQALPNLDWLREELLYEVNRYSGPVPVVGILFREFVIY